MSWLTWSLVSASLFFAAMSVGTWILTRCAVLRGDSVAHAIGLLMGLLFVGLTVLAARGAVESFRWDWREGLGARWRAWRAARALSKAARDARRGR